MLEELFKSKAAYWIHKLGVDLSGKMVLTEAGTNFYNYTPLLPVLANADHVFVWCRDSSYGKADTIEENLLRFLGKSLSERVTIRKNKKIEEDIQRADIITNSGALRPINSEFLRHAKETAVIPLMFEAWEIRKEDVDIEYIRKRGLKIAGTWENHPDIRVFEFAGHLAIKLAFEAGMEIFQNNVYIWSDDHFGEIAEKYLKALGANIVGRDVNLENLLLQAPNLDWIYVCDYSETRPYFGKDGIFGEVLFEKNPKIHLIHLYGDIDLNLLSQPDKVYPHKSGRAMVMTQTLAYVGPEPIIRLQAASLKVAQELISGKHSELVQSLN